MAAAPAMPSTISTMVATRQKLSFRRMRRRSTMRPASSDMVLVPYRRLHRAVAPNTARLLFCIVLVAVFVFFAFAFERSAQNVAQRRSGIRRSVLGDRFLFLGDFQRLDGDRDPA